MVKKYFTILSLMMFLLAGCTIASPTTISAVIASDTPTLEFIQSTPIPTVSATPDETIGTLGNTPSPASNQQIVLNKAFEVIDALKNKDMVALSGYVHPQLGLRFSPYAYVKDTDQVFTADKTAGLMEDSTLYLWGNYDGTGEPINLTFADYYAKFVYDVDFADAPQLSLNHQLGTGNSIDNILEYYPGSMVVEFYFPGFDPQYQGMDWRSLRLVFLHAGQDWYLAGIIHDQWTI
jgi:hypothetical protein